MLIPRIEFILLAFLLVHAIVVMLGTDVIHLLHAVTGYSFEEGLLGLLHQACGGPLDLSDVGVSSVFLVCEVFVKAFGDLQVLRGVAGFQALFIHSVS